jgi:hypothetical protein
MARLVVVEADVLPYGWFEMHMVNRMLDAIERRGDIVISANNHHFEVGLLRHCGT